MKLISVNVGLPREVTWRGIYKQPLGGGIALRQLNLDGGQQADLSVHGGEYKAVFCYPLVHYDYWRNEMPGQELPMGAFGENSTTEGLLEEEVYPGDGSPSAPRKPW